VLAFNILEHIVRSKRSFICVYCRIHLGFPVKAVVECNGLEEKLVETEDVTVEDNSFEIELSPFQIRSFLVHF